MIDTAISSVEHVDRVEAEGGMLIAYRSAVLAVLLGALASPGPALAQGTGGFGVGAALITGVDSRNSDYPAGIVGAGLDVSVRLPRVSFGLEVDVPRSRSFETTGRLTRLDGVPIAYFRRWSFRGSIVAGTVGFHAPAIGPVDLSFVTGLGVEYRRFGDFLTEDTLDAAGHVVKHEVIDTPYDGNVYRWLQVPLGVNAAIRVSRHVSVVPQFRFYFDPLAGLNDGCCDSGQVRGRVSLRWVF